mgnify:CR=1 FL=1
MAAKSAPVGRDCPQRLQCSFLAKTWSWHLGQIQSPGRKSDPCGLRAATGVAEGVVACPFPPTSPAPAPPSMSTVTGFGVPHFRHCGFLAKLWSPQLGQSQSPGLIGRPLGAILTCAGGAASSSSWLGLGAPQRRHFVFRANCRSPQALQFQSPGLVLKVLPVGAGVSAVVASPRAPGDRPSKA